MSGNRDTQYLAVKGQPGTHAQLSYGRDAHVVSHVIVVPAEYSHEAKTIDMRDMPFVLLLSKCLRLLLRI